MDLCSKPTKYGSLCALAKGHREEECDSCAWHVDSIRDKGRHAYYRFFVIGRVVQHGEPDEKFIWNVPSVDDPRYVLEGAAALPPSV